MTLSQETCLEDLLRARAAQFPARPALSAPGNPPRPALNYADLYAQTVQVQRALNRLGIGRGDRVAIVLPNGPEMAAAFLGVAACAACAPLNPAYRSEEFEFYLDDLDAQAVILLAGQDSPARRVAAARGIATIDLLPTSDGPAGAFHLRTGSLAPLRPIDKRGGPAAPSDLALVLHTSGTTSRPKMVALSGANLCASAEHIRQTLALTGTDRCLNVMPLFHIHGLMACLLASLAAGASVCCTPGFEAARFFAWLEEARPTWYSAVPTMHQSVLGQAESHAASLQAARLRFVRSSSASLPPQVMAALEAAFQAPVIEAYGMTEAAHQMASNPLPPGQRKPGSVGLPAGPQIAILDPGGAALPAGQVGEIAIRGPNVTPGYLNNPAANQGAFPNGWFRTGDQGYFDPDGYLFITGRLKEMINRGGEKVTPREVDEALMDHPAVAQAVTFAVRHPTLGEDVAAAVTLKPGAVATPRAIRQFALERLAAHKAPSQVIILDQIPKGPTGKLQRIGLGDKLADRLRPEFSAPRGQIETLLAGLWQSLLPDGGPFSADDNFFLCGGDSLLALALLARIRDVFEIDLPVGSIFQDPTIREQAARIEAGLLDQIEARREP